MRLRRQTKDPSTDQRLFAIYQAPALGVARQHAILLCNPFGQEAIRAHRFYKVVADRLNKAGFHVMRFDYYGTGDSDGDDDEVDFEAWTSDIRSAHSELLRLSGCANASWIGLRLGASVAAIASKSLETPLCCLLLWEPITNGAEYLAELMSAHELALQRDYGARDAFDSSLAQDFASARGLETLGFMLTTGMRQWLERLSTADFEGLRAGSTIAYSRHASSAPVSGRSLQSKRVPTEIDWAANEMMNASVVPAEILEAIVDEVSGLA
jgi:uncharacterized protein